MTRQLVERYEFDASAKTITLPEFDRVDLDRLVMIINARTGQTIFNFVDTTDRATVSGNTITVSSTTGMVDTDPLTVIYDVQDGDPYSDVRTIVGNARDKLYESFVTVPASLDLTQHPADDIRADGNAAGVSYMVVSKSIADADTETWFMHPLAFRYPLEFAVGLSLSQNLMGQAFYVDLVAVDDETEEIDGNPGSSAPPVAISASISVTSNVWTVTTGTPHGLAVGDQVVLHGSVDSRLNVGPIYVTGTPSTTQFTFTSTLANGTYPAVGGQVQHFLAAGGARNAFGFIFGETSADNLRYYTRADGGDPFISAATSFGSLVRTALAPTGYTGAFTYALDARTNLFLRARTEEIIFGGRPANSTGGNSATSQVRSTTQPDPNKKYRVRVRAVNLPNYSRHVAEIVSAAKAGSTTVTVTTDVAHGLAVGNVVTVAGISNVTDFPFTTGTVASVPSATTFTIVMGATTVTNTNTSGGAVFLSNGGQVAPVAAQSVTSMTVASELLTLTGSTNWAGLVIGDTVTVEGMSGAAAAYDGRYKVGNISTTALTLVAPGKANIGATATGGAVVKHTDLRLNTMTCVAHTRHRVELSAISDMATTREALRVAGTVGVTGTVSINSPTLTSTANRQGVAAAGIWYDDTATALAASATFTGSSRDIANAATATAMSVSSYPAAARFSAVSDVAGTLYIEVSRDNATWRRVRAVPAAQVEAGAGLFVAEIEFKPSTRYIRAVYVNGATAQTQFMLQSFLLAA